MKGKQLFLAAVALTAVATHVAVATDTPDLYDIRVTDDRVSLRATESPLLEIVTDLGRRLDFEVIADPRDDRRVTIEFESLPVEEAIRRLCKPNGYMQVNDPQDGRIRRLVLPSPHQKARPARSVARQYEPPRREPEPYQPDPALPAPVEPEAPDPTKSDDRGDDQVGPGESP